MGLRKYPGSKIWHYQTKVNGRKWSRSTGESDRRKAKAKVPELEALAELHRKQPGRLLKFSQAMLAEIDRIEQDLGPQAAQRVAYSLKALLKWLRRDVLLEKIDTGMLEGFQRSRLRECATSTVNRDLSLVLWLLRRNGFVVAKPEPMAVRRTEQRSFTVDELREFFGAIRNKTHEVLFKLMLVTGARPTELIPSTRSGHVPLLKREVIVEKGTVVIRTAKLRSGRMGRVREIRIPDDVMALLVEQLERVEGQHVFPLSTHLHQLFDRILKRAGIPKFDELGRKLTAHSFRHTYATIQAEKVNLNPFMLRAILGHSQSRTTDRYCHTRSEAEVVDISELLGKGVSTGCGSDGSNDADVS